MIRAAELRPSLDDEDCYSRFVGNIDSYFRSMTDPTVEHESFLNMRQLDDEPIVRFHTRLMEKVRLCGYSPSDQARFVHLQLLKGMRNQELARFARLYGHDTPHIIQIAARNEAFEIGTQRVASEPSAALAMERTTEKRKQLTNSSSGFKRERNSRSEQEGIQRKRFRPTPSESCKQCGRFAHKNPGMCPAKQRSCNKCKKRGHFAIMCRTKQVNNTEDVQQATSDELTKHEHEV